MRKWIRAFQSIILLTQLSACVEPAQPGPPIPSAQTVQEKARQLAGQLLILDTHVDIPNRLVRQKEDISIRTPGGDFDYPRAREGGLDAAFMSIYVPASFQESGGAREHADRLIDMVVGFERAWPDKFQVVRSVSELRAAFGRGRVALPMGMENGAPIEGSLENLQRFYDRGVRYITLTHSRSNHIGDSSYDSNRRWHGLSPFGRTVVEEMNRLGIIIDVSHASDDAFHQVIELTKAPVIASHSSCRHFTPGWERNMSDDMIRKLAANGGVIQISFGSSFISNEYRLGEAGRRREIDEHMQRNGLTRSDHEAQEWIRRFEDANPLTLANVSEVADHIDHVRRLVGVDHVGFGSDFDGVGGTTPTGLRDVSHYPNLLAELLQRGYSTKEIQGICSGNLLRVWEAVERIAEQPGEHASDR